MGCSFLRSAVVRFLFLVACASLCACAQGAPFNSRDQLKAAVDNCLAVDATGVTCCATADCGPAGSAEMKDWDVSSVTDMAYMFNQAWTFNADLSSWDVTSCCADLDPTVKRKRDSGPHVVNYDVSLHKFTSSRSGTI